MTFTTARHEGGTGLGLHIVYNLVTQKLGGTIRCESQVGKGTNFIMDLPIHSRGRSERERGRVSEGAREESKACFVGGEEVERGRSPKLAL